MVESISSGTAEREGGARIASLARWPASRPAFQELRARFARANPGHAIDYWHGARQVEASERPRALFVHQGEADARIEGHGRPPARSPLAVGDLVMLREGESLVLDRELALLAFALPDPLPAELPAFVRPDWDPRLTDTPGGCAEEGGAYRRILLTWLASNGPYVFHDLNAHRVRMVDSFSHYHPREGGFDELYLVQGLGPEARLFTSERVERLLDPERVDGSEVATLIEERTLAVGDLVYLPRGTMHRAIGGVLAQVITVPGFRPGAEIGLDHHLRAINERFDLRGEQALPYREVSSRGAVVK